MTNYNFDITLNEKQMLVCKDNSRFISVVAGRRFGKSYLSAYKMGIVALLNKFKNIVYLAPTFQMAKRIMMPVLLEIIPFELIKSVSKSDLIIELKTGSKIYLGGSQNYNAFRGIGIDFAVLDEVADIPKEAWIEVIRPALSDRKGNALFIGTPKGKSNWFYDVSTNPDYSNYHFTTLDGGYVDYLEVESAKNELDSRTFKQEYEASFESFSNTAYYSFSEKSIISSTYNKELNTYLCWDFNAGEKPIACILVQEQQGKLVATNEFVVQYTNTDTLCQIIKNFFIDNGLNGNLTITGDWSGKRRESSASSSDYDIIEYYFKNYPNYKEMARPTLSIKDRVASLNSYLLSYDGTQRLFINKECKKLINDLYKVEFKENGMQLEDKNAALTHASDALSYLTYNLSKKQTDVRIY